MCIRDRCICQGTALYVCSQEFAERMGEICTLMKPYKEMEYYINEEDVPSLCAMVLPAMDQYAILKKPEKLEQYTPKPCVITIYMDCVEGKITAMIYGDYGEVRYNLVKNLQEKDLYRDIEKERAVLALAGGYFTHLDPVKDLLFIPKEEEEAQYQMLSTGISQFQQLGEVLSLIHISMCIRDSSETFQADCGYGVGSCYEIVPAGHYWFNLGIYL